LLFSSDTPIRRAISAIDAISAIRLYADALLRFFHSPLTCAAAMPLFSDAITPILLAIVSRLLLKMPLILRHA